MSASFESQLVGVAQGVFEPHRSPPVPEMPRSVPTTLSRHCIEAIKQAITIGSAELLVRRATGWRRQRFSNSADQGARSSETIRGRIWERHPQFHLRFSDRAIQTLTDVASGSLLRNPGELEELAKNPGDAWLDFLLYRRYRKTNLGVALRKYRAIQSNGLIQLAYVADFTHAPESEIEVNSWVSLSLSAITESFQDRLAQRWLKLELEKRRTDSATRLRERARRQDAILTSWLATCEASQRRDLARFVLILGGHMVNQFHSVDELFAKIRWEDRRGVGRC